MKEATITTKGFKVIPLTVPEIQKFGTVSPVCDYCCEPLLTGGTFIPVLANRVFCDKCYTEWHDKAINYPEDHSYEQRATHMALYVLNHGK